MQRPLTADTQRRPNGAITPKVAPHQVVSLILHDLKHGRLELPVLPEVVTKINNMISNPAISPRNVAQVATQDAGLSARLMQLANSPLIRRGKPVDNVQEAVNCLGMMKVSNLLTSIVAKQFFSTSNPKLTQRLKDLWAHSTSVAAISALLAKRYTKISPDEAMLAGLLHDIGELPVLKYVEKYPGLANDAEWLLKVRVGVVPIIGRAILVSWNFPKEIVNAIAKPADIAQNSGPIELVDIVVVADLHSMIGSGISGYQRPLHDFPVIQKFGLEPKQSIKMLKEAREDIHLIQFALSS